MKKSEALRNAFLTTIFIHSVFISNAQTDSTKSLELSGYIETFYSYDFANPASHVRQPFLYSYNRHNEVNLDIGLVKLAYNTENIRANLALMAGTYANDNLSAEPGVMKNILEANTGMKLSNKSNLWLDAGIFASHIGFESAIGKDCWNLTRSLLAENSPYYESGIKISYTSPDTKWFLSGLLLNGWQRIYRVNGNQTPGFGHQLTYKPSAKITLNSSSFIGNDKPENTRQMRYFHNFYGIFQLSNMFALTTGLDIGSEESAKGSGLYNTWYAPVVILKSIPTNKLAIVARVEYYSDPMGVIIGTGSNNGFKTWGFSVNADVLIYDNVLWRTEFRGLNSKEQIFTLNDDPSNNNYFVTSSLAISF